MGNSLLGYTNDYPMLNTRAISKNTGIPVGKFFLSEVNMYRIFGVAPFSERNVWIGKSVS